MKKFVILGLLILISAAIFLLRSDLRKKTEIVVPSGFEECLDLGYTILESYPRQCRTPWGQFFFEDIGNELEKTDLIRVENPRPNQAIASPLLVRGQARGFWFFEADFPIRLYDQEGREIAVAVAQAKDEWMTEDFVFFEAVLEFSSFQKGKGLLVFEKDNPSGLAEFDDQLRVPVRFLEN